MDKITRYQVTAKEQGIRLDKFISEACSEISRSQVKALILKGQVQVDQITVSDPSKKLKLNQLITLILPEIQEAFPQAQSLPLEILYEDNDIIIINKAAGMVVHPAPGNRDNTLVNALLAHCGNSLSGIGGIKRPGIVHRLDKDTSGLLVAAKHDLAHRRLAEQFSARTLSRRYYAVVWGVPLRAENTIEGNIGRSTRNRKKMAILHNKGKPARTYYKLIKSYGQTATLVECTLESGRTHQIRVHMASQGHCVIGDALYGRIPRGINSQIIHFIKTFGSTPTRHALHAYRLELIHPLENKVMTFQTPLPFDIASLLKFLERI